MKALTAFRNCLKRKGSIEKIDVKCMLCGEHDLEFIVKFKYTPKGKNDIIEIFREARDKAEEQL